jgi:hypothetical protein
MTLLLIVCVLVNATAQARYGTLVIKAGETFNFGNHDILVADTLIMQDSSRILLNKLKKENYIRTKVAIFGKGCLIDGSGIEGVNGRTGRAGISPIGPCRDGTDASNGVKGLDGGEATHLILYLSKVSIDEPITVNLVGGFGGNGGNGGDGGSGSPGTVHCNGGNGGNGGNGAQGGNGGNGGFLTIDCKDCPVTYDWLDEKILVLNYGGREGAGGRGGAAGFFGGGPRGRNGKYGRMGTTGARGNPGKRGSVNFVIE